MILCLLLLQETNSPVPPALLQLGVAVVLFYLATQIVKAVLEFLGKSPNGRHPTQVPIKIELASDPKTEHRLQALEEQGHKYILRTEYESRHSDLLRQLSRIESKLDNLWAIRFVPGGKEDRE